MDRVKRLINVALLCCHFVRNCAYYKAGYNGKNTKANNDFWLTVWDNFIDISVLEWLKLFGDHNEKHHWKKVVEDQDSFKKEMLNTCGITEDELASCRKSFKEYRDKFVAHLDSEETMHIPELKIALAVVKYYYSYVAKELGTSRLRDLPRDIESYYCKCFGDSEEHFGK